MLMSCSEAIATSPVKRQFFEENSTTSRRQVSQPCSTRKLCRTSTCSGERWQGVLVQQGKARHGEVLVIIAVIIAGEPEI
mmetsp:Transcript_24145/g.77110  ORF Transcript_24145/g.77110 Transcript_24145/m.77110 type:complete len:80 (-) Transcript_24145:565-804(-)